MRPGHVECDLRVGDRVRWVPEDIPRKDMNVDPVGEVRGITRRFPRTLDLAVDRVHVLFDERIHLIEGMDGFTELTTDFENVEPLEE